MKTLYIIILLFWFGNVTSSSNSGSTLLPNAAANDSSAKIPNPTPPGLILPPLDLTGTKRRAAIQGLKLEPLRGNVPTSGPLMPVAAQQVETDRGSLKGTGLLITTKGDMSGHTEDAKQARGDSSFGRSEVEPSKNGGLRRTRSVGGIGWPSAEILGLKGNPLQDNRGSEGLSKMERSTTVLGGFVRTLRRSTSGTSLVGPQRGETKVTKADKELVKPETEEQKINHSLLSYQEQLKAASMRARAIWVEKKVQKRCETVKKEENKWRALSIEEKMQTLRAEVDSSNKSMQEGDFHNYYLLNQLKYKQGLIQSLESGDSFKINENLERIDNVDFYRKVQDIIEILLGKVVDINEKALNAELVKEPQETTKKLVAELKKIFTEMRETLPADFQDVPDSNNDSERETGKEVLAAVRKHNLTGEMRVINKELKEYDEALKAREIIDTERLIKRLRDLKMKNERGEILSVSDLKTLSQAYLNQHPVVAGVFMDDKGEKVPVLRSYRNQTSKDQLAKEKLKKDLEHINKIYKEIINEF